MFLTRRLACAETAADLTHELFLNLLNPTGNKALNIDNVRAYLYRAAANMAINHQTAERRRQKLINSCAENTTEPANTLTPERITSDEERLRLMTQALQELSPLAQQIFVLTRIQGLKQKEVAEKLDIHITTVEKNLSRAVRHCYARILQAEQASGFNVSPLSNK